jgi:hypothetical protein
MDKGDAGVASAEFHRHLQREPPLSVVKYPEMRVLAVCEWRMHHSTDFIYIYIVCLANLSSGLHMYNIPAHNVLQALSHFSYHYTSGQFVLCDLQGGIYKHAAVLTDPVVHSQDRRFGPTDLGMPVRRPHACCGCCFCMYPHVMEVLFPI